MDTQDLTRPRLLCFIDAMCSWCYGFEPELAKIADAVEERLDMVLFSGGLRPYTKEPMPAELRDKLSEAYGRIGELTGRVFRPAWQKDANFIYDTEPASRAVVTMRHLSPGDEFPFLSSLQYGFYKDGQDITKENVIVQHALDYDVPKQKFLDAFRSEAMRKATVTDFQVAQKLNVNGFPTLIVHRRNKEGKEDLVLVAQGYDKAENVLGRIDEALAGAAA